MAENTGRKAALARARLRDALVKHLAADFAAHGADVLSALRVEKPTDYLKLVTTTLQSSNEQRVAGIPMPIIVEPEPVPESVSGWEPTIQKIRRNLLMLRQRSAARGSTGQA